MTAKQREAELWEASIDAFNRADAIGQAIEAMGIEPTYTNRYRCDACKVEWEDTWSCACDDECPECGADISPYDSECDLDADD